MSPQSESDDEIHNTHLDLSSYNSLNFSELLITVLPVAHTLQHILII